MVEVLPVGAYSSDTMLKILSPFERRGFFIVCQVCMQETRKMAGTPSILPDSIVQLALYSQVALRFY